MKKILKKGCWIARLLSHCKFSLQILIDKKVVIIMVWGKSLASKFFYNLNVVLLMLFSLAAILPILYVVGASFGTQEEMLQKDFFLFPTRFSLDAYRYIFSTNTIARSMLVTVYITVVGTIINMVFTVLMAYPLSHTHLMGRKTILFLVTFTMMFNPGIIPAYLVVRALGMLNTWWALLIPNAIGAFYLIIMKNFFSQLPVELKESAKIDGANDMHILWRIIIPISLPSIATFSLFYAVINWNSFMNPLLYMNNPDRWPIQVLLRQIVLMSSGGVGDSEVALVAVAPQTVQMAVVVVATAPILLVYPFLQKYFVKGLMVGSIKG